MFSTMICNFFLTKMKRSVLNAQNASFNSQIKALTYLPTQIHWKPNADCKYEHSHPFIHTQSKCMVMNDDKSFINIIVGEWIRFLVIIYKPFCLFLGEISFSAVIKHDAWRNIFRDGIEHYEIERKYYNRMTNHNVYGCIHSFYYLLWYLTMEDENKSNLYVPHKKPKRR